MTEAEMIEKLRLALKKSRFVHTLGVADTAVYLAEKYGADKEKARIAGLLHDCAKNIPGADAIAFCSEKGVALKKICLNEHSLIHAYLGAYLAKSEYGVEDEEILSAIYYHTTGKEDMTLLEKIIYVADTIEPSRTHAGVDVLRTMAETNLDGALLKAIESTIRHILNKGGLLDTDTVAARNYLMIHNK